MGNLRIGEWRREILEDDAIMGPYRHYSRRAQKKITVLLERRSYLETALAGVTKFNSQMYRRMELGALQWALQQLADKTKLEPEDLIDSPYATEDDRPVKEINP